MAHTVVLTYAGQTPQSTCVVMAEVGFVMGQKRQYLQNPGEYSENGGFMIAVIAVAHILPAPQRLMA